MSNGAILGIDTAGPVVGAAMWWPDGGVLWSERVVRGADTVLIPAIDQLLANCALPLERVAVAIGPGAFTGLRVGVSTALGIALARGLRVTVVSSLRARAALAPNQERVLAILDARKGRVYAGLFDTRSNPPMSIGEECDAHLGDVLPSPGFVAVGEGADLYRAELELAGGQLVEVAAASPALEVARLGNCTPGIDPAEVALRYLRAPDAIALGAPVSHD